MAHPYPRGLYDPAYEHEAAVGRLTVAISRVDGPTTWW